MREYRLCLNDTGKEIEAGQAVMLSPDGKRVLKCA